MQQIDLSMAVSYAAARRSVERSRIGLPPGGLRGPPSSSHRASRMASMLTGALSPSGARSAGHEAIADASEAQDARIARFSASVRHGCATTSLGCSNTWPAKQPQAKLRPQQCRATTTSEATRDPTVKQMNEKEKDKVERGGNR